MAAAVAIVLAAIGLAAGGVVFQLLGLLAAGLAALGTALGFVGVTVARAGASRLVLSVLAMLINGVLLLAVIGLLATRS